MKTNTVAPIGGLIILAGALALAFYTGTNAAAKSASDAKTISKYVALSEQALAGGDSKKAEKIIQKAIAVDPKSKIALSEYKKIILSSAPKTVAPTPAQASAAASTKSDTKTTPKAEADDEMGCI